MNNKLRNKIMRRVYLAFAVRVLTHPLTVQLALFVLALEVFAKMVHVKSITDTLLSQPLGSVPKYIFNTFMHGEVLTLIAIGVMVFVALSVPLQTRRLWLPKVLPPTVSA